MSERVLKEPRLHVAKKESVKKLMYLQLMKVNYTFIPYLLQTLLGITPEKFPPSLGYYYYYYYSAYHMEIFLSYSRIWDLISG